MPINLIFRTDVHAADKGPVSWKGDYPAEIRSSLLQVATYAREHKASAVLDGGDFFHVKAPTRNSHELVKGMIDLHVQNYVHEDGSRIPVFSIEGNHDLAYNEIGSVARQPLGVMFASGAFQPLREEVFTEGSLRVRVVGIPFHPGLTLEEIQKVRKQPGDSYLVLLLHALAGMDPPSNVEDFFGEPVFRYDQIAATDDGADIVCLGHWHRDQGIEVLTTPTGPRWFVNQGALSRGALVRENLTRIPKAALLTFTPEGCRAEALPMKVAPAEEVFDLERKVRAEEEKTTLEGFVRRLAEDAQVAEAKDLRQAILAMEKVCPQEVLAEAIRYLELAES